MAKMEFPIELSGQKLLAQVVADDRQVLDDLIYLRAVIETGLEDAEPDVRAGADRALRYLIQKAGL